MRPAHRYVQLLGRIAGAAAFTACWFWLSLKAFDYWEMRQRDAPQSAQTNAVSPINPSFMTTQKSLDSVVYAMMSTSAVDANWQPASSKIQTKVTRDGVALSSNTARFEYQMQTSLITTKKDAAYVVNYNIDMTIGSVMIGVLDEASNQWIAQKKITGRSDSLPFKAASAKTRIILSNEAAGPLAGVVSQIFVSAVPAM
jgi:hypothetical protein